MIYMRDVHTMFQFSPSQILALSKLYEKSPITVDVTLMVPSVSVYDVDVNTSIHLSPPPFLALFNYFFVYENST
jgi:hypothetical protein